MTGGKPREKWTDERLDDLNQRIDVGFKEVREKFRAVRAEMSAINRLMIVGFISTIATILAHG